MATIQRKLSIEAPVERVFAYVNDPQNFPTYWPSMVEVSNVKHRPDGGNGFDFLYKMAGVKLRGHSDSVEYVENKHVTSKSEGAIPSRFDWDFSGHDGVTDISLKVDYQLPSSALGKLTEPILTRINERECDSMLDNLKSTLEGTKK
jgi:ribosome-associated toxin RatA of RatAB toxin-antitoxin module